MEYYRCSRPQILNLDHMGQLQGGIFCHLLFGFQQTAYLLPACFSFFKQGWYSRTLLVGLLCAVKEVQCLTAWYTDTFIHSVTIWASSSEFPECQNHPQNTPVKTLMFVCFIPVCRDDIQHHTHSHAHTHILHPPELARHTPSFWMAGTKPYVAVPKLLVTLVRFGLSERRQLNI